MKKRKEGKWVVIDKTNHVIGTGRTLHDARKDLLCKMTIKKLVREL